MKFLKLLIPSITALLFTSCVVEQTIQTPQYYYDDGYYDTGISLNELVSSYDLWYVDIHNTTGNAEVPFLERAFTVTFRNGRIYGNNNIANIGNTGNGFGIQIGNYTTFNEVLETDHRQGNSNFRIVQLARNEIRLDDLNQNVSYFLIGYQTNTFDYDKLFYDNIEYFLQEYVSWERILIEGGQENPFDQEHFLAFTPDNDNTFSSSQDDFGTTIDTLIWDYVGNYTIEDYSNANDVKLLTLFYDNNDVEKFNLYVVNDQTIQLVHLKTGTKYDFIGRGFIEYLRPAKDTKSNRNNNRIRRKIKRNSVVKI